MDEELQRMNPFTTDTTFKDYIIHLNLNSFQKLLTDTLEDLSISFNLCIESAYKELWTVKALAKALRGLTNVQLCKETAENVKAATSALQYAVFNVIKVDTVSIEISVVLETLKKTTNILRTGAEAILSASETFEKNGSYSNFRNLPTEKCISGDTLQSSDYAFKKQNESNKAHKPEQTFMDDRFHLEPYEHPESTSQQLSDCEPSTSTGSSRGSGRIEHFFRPLSSLKADDFAMLLSDDFQRRRLIEEDIITRTEVKKVHYEGKGKSIPSHLQYKKKFSWTLPGEKDKFPTDFSYNGSKETVTRKTTILGEKSKSCYHPTTSKDDEISVIYEHDLTTQNRINYFFVDERCKGNDESLQMQLQCEENFKDSAPAENDKSQQGGKISERTAKKCSTIFGEKSRTNDGCRLPSIAEDEENCSIPEDKLKKQGTKKDFFENEISRLKKECVPFRRQNSMKVSWSIPLETEISFRNINHSTETTRVLSYISSIIRGEMSSDSTDTRKRTVSFAPRSPQKVDPSEETSVKISSKDCPRDEKMMQHNVSENFQGSQARKRRFRETTDCERNGEIGEVEIQGDDYAECGQGSLNKKRCHAKPTGKSQEDNKGEKVQEGKYAKDDGKRTKKRRATKLFSEISDNEMCDKETKQMIPPKENQESSEKKRRVSEIHSLLSEDDTSDKDCKQMDSVKDDQEDPDGKTDKISSQKSEYNMNESELKPKDYSDDDNERENHVSDASSICSPYYNSDTELEPIDSRNDDDQSENHVSNASPRWSPYDNSDTELEPKDSRNDDDQNENQVSDASPRWSPYYNSDTEWKSINSRNDDNQSENHVSNASRRWSVDDNSDTELEPKDSRNDDDQNENHVSDVSRRPSEDDNSDTEWEPKDSRKDDKAKVTFRMLFLDGIKIKVIQNES